MSLCQETFAATWGRGRFGAQKENEVQREGDGGAGAFGDGLSGTEVVSCDGAAGTGRWVDEYWRNGEDGVEKTSVL